MRSRPRELLGSLHRVACLVHSVHSHGEMIKNATRTWLVGCVLASLVTPAFADDDGVPPVTSAPGGQYAVMRGVQSPAGMLSARILLDINLSADKIGKPISLAPDLYYGVTDKLQLGLLHDGPMGWQARPGLGLCLTGKDNGCPKVYDNVGFDLMYGLAFGQTNLSMHGSLFVSSFDPTTTSLALGVAGKLHFSENVALFFDPKIGIELSDRKTNDDVLYVPLELEYQLGAPTTFKVLGGISGNLSAFGDSYQAPLGVGLVHNLTEHFDLGARFSFDNLLGQQPQNVGRADTRSLAVLLNIRS
jgi:hypothetical protein